MTNYTDPAIEIARLKAQEKAAHPAWPAMPAVAPAKLKKAADLPDAPADGKKPPRHTSHSFLPPGEITYQHLERGGLTTNQIIRALLILGSALIAALLID